MAKDKASPGLPDILGFISSLQEERRQEDKLTKAQEQKKRGRKPKYSDNVIAKVSFVMLTKGIKEFKALWRYLKDNPQIRKKCGLKELPHRTTLMRRLKNFSPSA